MNTPRDALVILAVGVVATAWFGRPVLRVWRARRWPRVAGTVAASHVEDASPSKGLAGRRRFVHVTYHYTVGGKDYTGERVSFFFVRIPHRTEQHANADCKRYAKGTKVDVCHHPRDPTDAVIDPTIPWVNGAMAGFSALFFVFGLVGSIRMLLH